MAMLVEAPAAVEDALASLLDHTDPLVQVGGGVGCCNTSKAAEGRPLGCSRGRRHGDAVAPRKGSDQEGWGGWGGGALP